MARCEANGVDYPRGAYRACESDGVVLIIVTSDSSTTLTPRP